MKTALIDGDILCYRIGFACNGETEAVALMQLEHFLTSLVMTLPISDWEVHLSGKTNFRNSVAVTAPYKGNRKGNVKPVHYDAIRKHMIDKWDATVSDNEEADDTISIRATALGDDACIVSLDKDFDQCQGWHYNFVKGETYYITEAEGKLNFYMQFLTGDRIDNIIGVKGIGAVKARKLLQDCATDRDMYEVCVEKLGSEERAIENGILLHLRTMEDEIWTPPKP